ncbi:MAG: hypothetical protein ACKOHM_07795 [Spartobacteria bacterium]
MGLVFSGDEMQECAACGHDLDQAQDRDKQNGRLKQGSGIEEKEIEGRDIHNDRPQNEQAEVPRPGKNNKDPTEDFQNFGKSYKRALRFGSHRQPLQTRVAARFENLGGISSRMSHFSAAMRRFFWIRWRLRRANGSAAASDS